MGFFIKDLLLLIRHRRQTAVNVLYFAVPLLLASLCFGSWKLLEALLRNLKASGSTVIRFILTKELTLNRQFYDVLDGNLVNVASSSFYLLKYGTHRAPIDAPWQSTSQLANANKSECFQKRNSNFFFFFTFLLVNSVCQVVRSILKWPRTNSFPGPPIRRQLRNSLRNLSSLQDIKTFG